MTRIALLLFVLPLGCSSESKMPSPANRQIDFIADVQPIFTKHCLGCHGPQKQKGKYRVDIRESALKEEVIKPGDSAGSTLIHHILGMNDRKRMPPEAPYLSVEQVGILRAWIDQGAKWSDGK